VLFDSPSILVDRRKAAVHELGAGLGDDLHLSLHFLWRPQVISIEKGHILPGSTPYASVSGSRDTPVPLLYQANREAPGDVRSRVCGSVVDDDAFQSQVRLGLDARQGIGQMARRVVCWHDDRHKGGRAMAAQGVQMATRTWPS
jgi:hypothetical protein